MNITTFDPAEVIKKHKQSSTKQYIIAALIIGYLIFFANFYNLGAQFAQFDSKLVGRALSGFIQWQDFSQWMHAKIFKDLLTTVIMAASGILLATFFALPLAFMAARNILPFRPANYLLSTLFGCSRALDYLIWCLIFIRAFGMGPLSGILAIMMVEIGTLGKLYSEAIENLDEKQREGVRAVGGSKIQESFIGVLPQIFPVILSQSLYFFESNIRSATLIGALGCGGIGLTFVETFAANKFDQVAYLIILILIVVAVVDSFSGWLRRRFL